MKSLKFLFLISIFALFLEAGWDPYKSSPAPSFSVKDYKTDQTIKDFLKRSPKLKLFFEKAYAFAVFPMIGKGGIGFGAAYGEGKVYEKFKLVGKARLTQISVGLQLGGQGYSEIVFFKDKETFDKFKKGELVLSAQASAVAVKAGVSFDTDFNEGVAVFTLPKIGLMYEISVAGQKFDFIPYY